MLMTQTSPTMVIANVSERLTALEARVAYLEAENARLQAEDTRLQAENAELRRRLGLNSSNRHKPPSSDGYRTKRVQPALPKEQRASGGQAGHKGKTLRRVEKPDQVKVHLPQRCAVCGRTIAADEAHDMVSKRQVFAVPEPKLEVTEHRLGHIICCGQPQCGRYPSELRAPVHYGPGVRALVTKLSVDHKLPLAHMSTRFRDLDG